MKIFIILLCISFNSFAIDPDLVNRLQKVIDLQTLHKNHVGISVGIIDGDERVILNSGYKDLKNDIKLTNSDYFSIGSVSKTFTSLLLAVAVDRNLTNIDTKVEDILPEFLGNRAGKVTLRQLSTHTSGMQRDPKKLSDAGVFLPFENYKRSQVVIEVLNASYEEVKDEEIYSNLGISLLVLCLEEIFNEDFDDAIYQYVLNPLGLNDIKVSIDSTSQSFMSKKYMDSLDEIPVWSNLGVKNGVGSFKATTSLMLDYMKAQISPDTSNLSNAIHLSHKILQPFKDDSLAYGWFVLKRPLGNFLFHNGSTMGFLTDVYILPEAQKGIVAFSNTGKKVECLNDIFFFNRECIPTKLLIDSDDILTEYSSVYLDKSKKLSIVIDFKGDGVLTMYFNGQKYGVRLYKTKNDYYNFFGTKGSVTFNRDASGNVESLHFYQKSGDDIYEYDLGKI